MYLTIYLGIQSLLIIEKHTARDAPINKLMLQFAYGIPYA